MVLQAAFTLLSRVVPSGYYYHIAVSLTVVIITYAFAQGRRTNRERDLHARTILVTGAFSPVGLTTLSNLASRGAHIIALSPYPLEHPAVTLLIPALREETKNEHIFVEHADLASPASIREFCTKFLTGDEQRLDAVVFAHEYDSIGSVVSSKKDLRETREAASLATFLMTTLLLPALLVAPVERDIRIVNFVNPFYAAATPAFTSELLSTMSPDAASTSPTSRSVLLAEGHRALRTVVFARHLQRILNALPNRAPTLDSRIPGDEVPTKDESVPASSPSDAPREKKNELKLPSNIVAVTVCPGVSRTETIRALLGLESEGSSVFVLLLYLALYPLVWIFAKSPDMAVQTVLHALFLPSPFKRALAQLSVATDPSAAENSTIAELSTVTEVLKPGALYRECSVVPLKIAPLPDPPQTEGDAEKPQAKEKKKDAKGKAKAKEAEAEMNIEIEDDGEYGGEGVGRVVWEWYERGLKTWEAEAKSDGEKPAS
ncbi:hypothetical protein BDW22DRAFT_1356026 [Trametopsis cervina]|nr:hypothetical protein BDW22DRAFT_1356026 [Trametopsis cervina]